MKKIKLLLLLLLIFMSGGMRAAVKGDIFTVGEFSYLVTDADNHIAEVAGCSASGAITLPLSVVDKNHIRWSVKIVSMKGRYDNVTAVTIPEGYVGLSTNAFDYSKITTIHIPASVVNIENGALGACENLQSITVAEGNSKYSAKNGVLYGDNGTNLLFYPRAKTDEAFVIPDGVKTITDRAFLYNFSIKDLTLPASLANIVYTEDGYAEGRGVIVRCDRLENIHVKEGNTAFKEIDGVVFSADGTKLMLYPSGNKRTSYAVPNTVTSIGYGAFAYSSFLKKVDLPANLTNISSCAFMYSGIVSFTLPAKLTNLENSVFTGCYGLTAINADTNNPNYCSVDGVLFNKAVTELMYYPAAKPGDYVVPGTVSIIGSSACQDTRGLRKMTFPPLVTTIEDYAFQNSSITELAFQGKSELEKIGDFAFLWANLSEIRIPASVGSIGRFAFNGQGKEKSLLKSVVVEDGSQLVVIDDEAFAENLNLESFTFEGTSMLGKVGDRAFRNDASLKSFEFSEMMVLFGKSAFNGCKSMTQAVFKGARFGTRIDEGAFQNCGLENVVLPAEVRTIEQSAFANCANLRKIFISERTSFIDARAFQNCTSLTDIEVSPRNDAFASVDGMLLSKDKKELKIFPPGKANDAFTLLPPSITTIGDYAFYDCWKLKNLTIPNKVTKIGKAAFQLCENMNSLTFLCDEMIDPANIAQGGNDRAFDDGTYGSKNMFSLIGIHVRKHLADSYRGSEFYKKFRSIGTSFTDFGGEYIPVSDNSVDLVSATTANHTYVVPLGITHAGREYKVAMIGDYAFQNVGSTVKEVVVRDNIGYIGAKAFVTDIDNLSSTIESVFLIRKTPTKEMLSTVRFGLDETGHNYSEFAASTKIYVKKSALDAYRDAWAKTVYAGWYDGMKKSPFDFTSQLEYRIPGVKIAKKYGTFAREFDADFSAYYNERGHTPVAAFTAGSGILPGVGDYGTSTYHVRMRSIDEMGGVRGNCGYVPTAAGVLLKVLDRESTPVDFFYTIGEEDIQRRVPDNIMHEVILRDAKVEASATEPVYVMQDGVFRKVTEDISSFPVHKAYMKPGTLPAGAKVVLVFDDGETTGIETAVADGAKKAEGVYYNLNGQRVENPQRGVYIRNGRKIVIK